MEVTVYFNPERPDEFGNRVHFLASRQDVPKLLGLFASSHKGPVAKWMGLARFKITTVDGKLTVLDIYRSGEPFPEGAFSIERDGELRVYYRGGGDDFFKEAIIESYMHSQKK